MADDLFDQVKQELEENEGNEAEGAAGKSAADMVDEISWDDVAADLDEQREMIKEEARPGKSGKEPTMDPGNNVDGLLPSLDAEQRRHLPDNINFILDIPLQLSVELGRTRMIINDLLQLGQGSVVELEKLAGEPLDILVNNKLVARGEVVVVNEKFGIRLTDIISPIERIEKLK
jgi:flagellar motor switch protein FliN/FliY